MLYMSAAIIQGGSKNGSWSFIRERRNMYFALVAPSDNIQYSGAYGKYVGIMIIGGGVGSMVWGDGDLSRMIPILLIVKFALPISETASLNIFLKFLLFSQLLWSLIHVCTRPLYWVAQVCCTSVILTLSSLHTPSLASFWSAATFPFHARFLEAVTCTDRPSYPQIPNNADEDWEPLDLWSQSSFHL